MTSARWQCENQPSTADAWSNFSARFNTQFTDNLAADLGRSREDVAALIRTFLVEAEVGLRLVEPHLRDGMRILEVGAGMGFLANFLAEQGFLVTALEPDSGGFNFMVRANDAVSRLCHGGDNYAFTTKCAEEIREKDIGQFDLIFSVHVLEHVKDVGAAMAGMASVLGPNGVMVHLCPNYTVPYEPHLGIALVPFSPRLTRFLCPARIERSKEIWEGLSFITAGDIRKQARKNGLTAKLVPGVMGEFIARLAKDPVFANRHRGFLQKVLAVIEKFGVLSLLLRLPPAVQTPMISVITKNGTAAAAVVDTMREQHGQS